MGLTIHYSGKLKNASALKSLIEEVRDVAIEKKWKYFVFDEAFKNETFTQEPDFDTLYGIMVTPEGSEPLCFSFLSDGRMCGLINFKVIELNQEIDEDLAFSLFTKTQYAGFETHKELIILMDYISKKYLTDFECYDEGEYWETRDEDLLIKTFSRFDTAINSFASSLEMMPPNENENIEDFIQRLADSTQNRISDLEDNLPKLPIEDENKFKRMKIELEHGGIFGKANADIPPEIESIFLDNIIQFENQFKNAKQITVFEKIGKPDWKNPKGLNEEELEAELDRLYKIMEEHDVFLEVLYDYENESELIYNFITQEFFEVETNDMSIPGMMSNFIYEEFHPNHYEDLKKDSLEFWTDFLGGENDYFDNHTLAAMSNSAELKQFRNSFLTFKNIIIDVTSVDFDLEKAEATSKVKLHFEAFIDKQDKIIFDFESSMNFIYQYDFWHLKKAELPKSI